MCVFSPSLPGRPLKYGGESSSLSITQSPFLPRWRAKKSSALTAGIPYGPYPWPCSQAQHVLMDKCPERIRVFLSRFSAPCSLIVYAACALWECATAHSCSSESQLTTRLESVEEDGVREWRWSLRKPHNLTDTSKHWNEWTPKQT